MAFPCIPKELVTRDLFTAFIQRTRRMLKVIKVRDNGIDLLVHQDQALTGRK